MLLLSSLAYIYFCLPQPFAHDIGLQFSSSGLKLECLNADTPRGFSLTISSEAKIRTPANAPSHVEIELPIGRNLVLYYGERSGELGHYISQVTSASEPTENNPG